MSLYEETLVIIKPDAFRRGLVGEIISRFEKSGYNIILNQIWMKTEEAEALYECHKGKEFYPKLVEFMTSGYCVTMKAGRVAAVSHARKLIGADGQPVGSIRGDMAAGITQNVCHASDSLESAQKELPIFFPNENY